MIHKISAAIALCVIAGALMAFPLSRSIVPQDRFGGTSEQDKIELAVHEQRLNDMEKVQSENAQLVRGLDTKLNWIIGGIIGINGLLAIIGVLNRDILKKRGVI